MDRRQAQDLMPRFLNAVTGMAVARGAVHARVAGAVSQIAVFGENEFPEELRPKYAELQELLGAGTVSPGAENHPDFRKQAPAYYPSPQKASRAADLIIEIFEAIVYTLNDFQ